MLKNVRLNLILVVLSITFIVSGFILMNRGISENYTGILFGLGAGMFGVTLSNIFTNLLYNKKPEMEKIKNIELNDERNKFLQYKTGNTIYRINTYIMCIFAIIIAVFKFPIWVTLLFPGILFIDSILYVLVFNKNNQLM